MSTKCFATVFHRPDKSRPSIILHRTSRAASLTAIILIQRTAREYGEPIFVPRKFSYVSALEEAHRVTGETRIRAEVIHVELSDIVVRWLKGVQPRPLRLAEKENWPMVPKDNHPSIYDEVMSAPRVPVLRAADHFNKRRQEAKSGAWRIR